MATAVAGAAELVAALTTGAARARALMPVVVEKCAHDFVALVQTKASGRPGPNAPTGDYRGSWTAEPVIVTPEVVSWSGGTDRAQANRLEYGFGGSDAVNTDGVDSLGRHYHQQPLPHMGPAADEIDPIFTAAMAAVADQAVTW